VDNTQLLKTLYAELDAKATGAASDQTLDSLFEFFKSSVLPAFTSMQKDLQNAKLGEELDGYKVLLLDNKTKTAEAMKSRYEVITREFSNQNKQLTDNHNQIVSAEEKKREEIRANFNDHINSVTSKMQEDYKGESSVVEETKNLETQYLDLLKEIEEKTKLMDDEIKNKSESTQSIQGQIKGTIDEKRQEMTSQADAFKKGIVMKIEEEKNLLEILKDYKAKYGEFDKSMKKSRDTFKQFTKEIKMLDANIKLQEQEKTKLTKQGGKKKKG
jgi:chromosome segregation ATPase